RSTPVGGLDLGELSVAYLDQEIRVIDQMIARSRGRQEPISRERTHRVQGVEDAFARKAGAALRRRFREQRGDPPTGRTKAAWGVRPRVVPMQRGDVS